MTNKTEMSLQYLIARCTDYDDMTMEMYASDRGMLLRHISRLEAAEEELAKEKEHSATFEREANLYHGKCEAAEARIAELEKCNLEYATNEQKQDATIAGLNAELAKLKGDAAPVAWTDEEELRDMEKYGHAHLFKAEPLITHEDPRRMIKLFTHAQPVPFAVADAGIVRDANRYRFLRDSDSWGEDSDTWDPHTQTGLISSSNLITLETGSFDAAVDARMAASDIPFYNPAQPAPVVVLPTTYWTFDDDKNPVFDADEVIAALEKSGVAFKYADGEGE